MNEQPQLEPPGNGIPFIERWVGHKIIFWKSRRTTLLASMNIFKKEQETLLKMVYTLPAQWRDTPILIKRLPGLEDSSRYWSAYMVLAHLNMVNLGTLENIRQLEQGIVPSKAVLIENVKPSPTLNASTIDEFELACQTYVSGIESLGQLQSTLTYPHPWFGPMKSSDWHFMMGFHMTLHRKQMAAIIKAYDQQSVI